MKHKSIFNWSGGKDSAIALHYSLQNPQLQIDQLFTSVNKTHQRVSMHGVREELLDLQAKNIGIPLEKLLLNDQPSMSEYNRQMELSVSRFKDEGFTHSIFGDIFLEDLKKYREDMLATHGFKAVFPIWKRDTKALLNEFLDLGFKTILVCIKAELLDKSFAGRVIDKDFLKDLPDNVDPCGENGEFHTFVFDGPIFKQPIKFEKGEVVFREYKAPKNSDDTCNSETQPKDMGFWFCDLIPQ